MVDTVKNSKLFWCVRKFSSYQFKVLVVKPKFVHNRVLSCPKFLDKSLPIPDETLTFIKYILIKNELKQEFKQELLIYLFL